MPDFSVTKKEIIETQVLIIGAGPCGLFQVFELGLLDLRAHIVDSLPRIGGQCMELYPDKPIYDIPALPECSARQLIDNLQKQIEPFQPEFHLRQTVTELEKDAAGHFMVATNTGTRFRAGAVIICGGVGSFAPRRLSVVGAEQYEGANLHYKVVENYDPTGRRIVVAGGGDSALDWALRFQEKAKELTLIHRRETFRASPASVTRARELEQAGRLRLRIGRIKGLLSQEDALSGLCLDENGQQQEIELDDLFVLYGLSPKLGPIADWGFDLEKKQIAVDTEKFQTSIPGVFAVGDINTYPGKKKLILSGFHEGALAAYGVANYLEPDKKQYVQYTTTSPIVHKRLGLTAATGK